MPSAASRKYPGIRAPLLLLLLLLAAVPSEAADTVSVDVGAVYASNEGTSIDPALGTIRGKLQSMFNYTSYRMLDRKRRTLSVGEAGEFELPGRRTMRASLLPAEADKVRLSIRISAGPRNLLTTTLGLRRGGMVLVGGPTHQAGVLILIISAE